MKRSVSTRRLAFHTGSLWQLRADNDTVSCAYRTQDAMSGNWHWRYRSRGTSRVSKLRIQER